MPSRTDVEVLSADANEPHPIGAGAVGLRGRLWQLATNQQMLLLFALLVLVAAFTSQNARYLSTRSFANILQDWAPVMLMATGETFVIISGGIDISVGSILGLAGVVCALVMQSMTVGGADPGLTIAAGVGVGALVGLGVGLVNGLMVTKLGLAPFIATLATLGAAYGLTLVISHGQQIGGGPQAVTTVGNSVYLGMFTVPLITVIAIVAASSMLLAWTQFGRWTQAIGSNRFSARGAGIDVNRHLLMLYAFSGVLAGLAGVVVYFRLASGAPTSGSGQELTAIAAVVIGGASLSGGSGSMVGTILGALIISSILSGLIFIGIEPSWQQVAVGGIIAGAVFVQGLTRPAGRAA